MNYEKSQEILEEIKKAKKILLNCHVNPDADSVGSALAFYYFLKSLNKETKIICPSVIPDNLLFLDEVKDIEVVDFRKFKFDNWELFITLDSATWKRVVGNVDVDIPPLKIIAIDHHDSNDDFGAINLVKKDSASNCEILFGLFEDWKIEIDSRIANALLTGVMGDTGGLRFPETKEFTFKVVENLIHKGADKQKIIFNLFQNYSLDKIKFWVEILKNIKIDGKVVWSAISIKDFKDIGLVGAKSEIADLIFENVKDTDIGIVMVGEDKRLDISFRSRTGKDVSAIAEELGGGGHTWSAAAKITGMSFNESVEKVLQVAKKYV